MIQCPIHPCRKYALGFGPCCLSPHGGNEQAFSIIEQLEIRFPPPNILMLIILTRNSHPSIQARVRSSGIVLIKQRKPKMLALKFQRTVCYQRLDRWGAPFLPCLSQPLKDDPALLYSASYSSKTSSFFNIWFRWYMLSIGISYPRHSFVPFWLPTRFLCIAKGQDVISLSCHDRLFGIWSIF